MGAAVATDSPELAEAPARRAGSDLRARLAHRLSMHLARAPFAMRNARPMASFTFDDVPESALTVGAAMLEEAGVAGTFYIAAGLLGQRARDWRILGPDGVRALHRAGHEIGCHTFSHARASDLGRAAIVAEAERNRAVLLAVEPELRLDNFAFPYGHGSVAAKRAFAGRFASSRGILPALNAGRVDLQMLAAFPLIDGAMGRGAIDRVLDAAVRRNAWVIFYTHDVADRPSPFGCTPGLLAHALDGVHRRGIAPATIAGGLALAGLNRGA